MTVVEEIAGEEAGCWRVVSSLNFVKLKFEGKRCFESRLKLRFERKLRSGLNWCSELKSHGLKSSVDLAPRFDSKFDWLVCSVLSQANL